MLQLATLIAAISLGVPEAPAQAMPSTLNLTSIRALPTQHDGRWPPLDTVARDYVEDVTGDAFFGGCDPVLTLLAWAFDPSAGSTAPLFRISNAELRGELQLPQSKTLFSYAELVSHPALQEQIDALAHIPQGQKMNPLQSKVSDIHSKLRSLSEVFGGQAIRIIPNADDARGAWSPVHAPGHSHSADDPVEAAWSQLGAAFQSDDAAAFMAASGKLAQALGALPAKYRPSAKSIATELRYNKIRPFRTAWQVMVAGALFSALAMLVRRKWFDVLAIVALVAGFATLSYGLSMRWQIAGRIPASNMFESLLFLGWGMGAFAILAMIFLRHRIVPMTASIMGALALVLADCLPLDSFVRPITPVLLDTVWMSIHVPIIMVSYSVLALAVLFAHLQIIMMASMPKRESLIRNLDMLHYWYVHVGSILLLAGIVTGSMWAASSWGRYWGWDPKEVWSLVAFLGYLAILHVRIDHDRVPRWVYGIGALLAIGLFALVVPKLAPMTGGKVLALAATGLAMVLFVMARGIFAAALKSILAFWLIIMTYVGVNYVLGIGLHSYGFGTGAVVRYMFTIGGIDLALVGLCSLVYLLRKSGRPAGGGVSLSVAGAR